MSQGAAGNKEAGGQGAMEPRSQREPQGATGSHREPTTKETEPRIQGANATYNAGRSIHFGSRLGLQTLVPDFYSKLWLQTLAADFGFSLCAQTLAPAFAPRLWTQTLNPDFGSEVNDLTLACVNCYLQHFMTLGCKCVAICNWFLPQVTNALSCRTFLTAITKRLYINHREV